MTLPKWHIAAERDETGTIAAYRAARIDIDAGAAGPDVVTDVIFHVDVHGIPIMLIDDVDPGTPQGDIIRHLSDALNVIMAKRAAPGAN